MALFFDYRPTRAGETKGVKNGNNRDNTLATSGRNCLCDYASRQKVNGPVIVECPRHAGAFDCPPFCQLCGGDQELSERAWRAWFRPDTFTCGDDYHECDHDDDDEAHVTWLMFYFPSPEDYSPDDDEWELIETAAAERRVWSLRGDVIRAGRDTSAEWLFITEKATNA